MHLRVLPTLYNQCHHPSSRNNTRKVPQPTNNLHKQHRRRQRRPHINTTTPTTNMFHTKSMFRQRHRQYIRPYHAKNQVVTRIVSISTLGRCIGALLSTGSLLFSLTLQNRVTGFIRGTHDNRYCFSLQSRADDIGTIVFQSSTQQLNFHPRRKVGIVIHYHTALCRQSNTFRICIGSVFPSNVNSTRLTFRRLGTGLSQRNLFTTRHGGPLPQFPGYVNLIADGAKTTLRSVQGIVKQQ